MKGISDVIITTAKEFCSNQGMDSYFLFQEPSQFSDSLKSINAWTLKKFFSDLIFSDFNMTDDSGVNWNPNNQDIRAIVRKAVRNNEVQIKLISINLLENLEELEKTVLFLDKKAESLVLEQINERQSRNEYVDNIDKAASIKRFLTDYTIGEIETGYFPDILCVY